MLTIQNRIQKESSKQIHTQAMLRHRNTQRILTGIIFRRRARTLSEKILFATLLVQFKPECKAEINHYAPFCL